MDILQGGSRVGKFGMEMRHGLSRTGDETKTNKQRLTHFDNDQLLHTKIILFITMNNFRHNTEPNMEASIVFDIENPYHTESIIQRSNTPSESGCSTTVPLELYYDPSVDDDNTMQTEAHGIVQNDTEKEENTPDQPVPAFVCGDCHKYFKYNSQLIQHMEQVHIFSKGSVELVACRKCRVQCPSEDLLAHVNTTHRDCNHEDNYYTLYIKTLKQIQRREEMIYGCDFSNCCMRFSRKTSLKKHQLIHEQNMEHECVFCKKRFNRAAKRNTHQRKCQHGQRQ
eukprot:724236_1